jgi:hypothetical protein
VLVVAVADSRSEIPEFLERGRSHGGAEARRKQREETTTRHKGNLRVPCSCLCVKHLLWLPTGDLHGPDHPCCAGAYISLAGKSALVVV